MKTPKPDKAKVLSTYELMQMFMNVSLEISS